MTCKMPDRFSSVAILALSALAGSIACGGSSGAPTAPNRSEPDDSPSPTPDVEGEWTRMAELGGVARDRGVALSIGDRGYVGLGQGTVPGNFQDFWEYDPETNSWTRIADFGGSDRFGAVGFSIGETGYIGTGKERLTGGHVSDFWENYPSTDSWARKADLGGF